jgi:YVTN family beta-propeller protein
MSSIEPDTFLGREIAGYQIEEIIGRGGMGVVYRAEHIRLGRKVALKVVAPQIAREEKFRERFLRESRTAGTLDHPNVVPMYDAGEADGVLYIAMRFVDGVDLATMIARDGPLEPARTARIVAQVASALDAAHEAGLVHRDVKPSNVLLPVRGAGRGEHAYLGDFGLTKRVLSESGVTGTSAFLGTIAYVAPEQIEGRPVDAKADQYSLACLTYECLTGRRPYDRETDIATLYAHIRDPFPSVDDLVAPELELPIDTILARAAAKKPADRYPSCGDMAEDLARVTNAAITGSSPLPVVKPGPRSTPRRIGLGLGVALLLLVLAVGGFLALRGAGTAQPLFPGHGVAVIDAETNEATAAAPLTDEPTAIAADPSAAWVASFSTDRISRVDVATYAVSVVGQVPDGAGPVAITAAQTDVEDVDYTVWSANSGTETLSVIDPEQPDRDAGVRALNFRPGGLAFADGVLWVIDVRAESVIALPQSGPLGEPIEVGAGPDSIVAGDGVVWVSNGLGESLSRIQVPLAGADTPIGLNFAPSALALDVESATLWVVDTAGDAVIRVDTNTRREVDRIEVNARPVAVAYGAGAVWVANAVSGTVSRIDPATNLVAATITVGGEPVGVAVSGTTVWVAVAGP